MKNLTKDELVVKICKWEQEAGESFVDYFMHDNVKTSSWAFWLIGKGFSEQIMPVIEGLEKGETYFDQEELFEIYSEYSYSDDERIDPVWQEGNYEKNLALWAEFLSATQSYQDRVQNFFKEN